MSSLMIIKRMTMRIEMIETKRKIRLPYSNVVWSVHAGTLEGSFGVHAFRRSHF